MGKRQYTRRPHGTTKYQRKLIYRKQFKVRALEVAGNKCFDCPITYNGTNEAIFHFHHVDPKTKVDGVANLINRSSWDTVLKEVKKCVLLCANCHALRHNYEPRTQAHHRDSRVHSVHASL